MPILPNMAKPRVSLAEPSRRPRVGIEQIGVDHRAPVERPARHRLIHPRIVERRRRCPRRQRLRRRLAARSRAADRSRRDRGQRVLHRASRATLSPRTFQHATVPKLTINAMMNNRIGSASTSSSVDKATAIDGDGNSWYVVLSRTCFTLRVRP